MARSLTVKHEEQPATSTLLNAFLLLAFAWLAVTAVVSAVAEPTSAGAAEILVQ